MKHLEVIMADSATDKSAKQQQVAQMINLSMTLSVEKKAALKSKLTSLTDDQLDQLDAILEEEKQMTSKAMQEFFTAHPEAYAKFERMVKNKVHEVYTKIEESERPSEEQRIEEVLQKF
jgi:hypothetical protein